MANDKWAAKTGIDSSFDLPHLRMCAIRGRFKTMHVSDFSHVLNTVVGTCPWIHACILNSISQYRYIRTIKEIATSQPLLLVYQINIKSPINEKK